jgi:hypothetical protein
MRSGPPNFPRCTVRLTLARLRLRTAPDLFGFPFTRRKAAMVAVLNY